MIDVKMTQNQLDLNVYIANIYEHEIQIYSRNWTFDLHVFNKGPGIGIHLKYV